MTTSTPPATSPRSARRWPPGQVLCLVAVTALVVAVLVAPVTGPASAGPSAIRPTTAGSEGGGGAGVGRTVSATVSRQVPLRAAADERRVLDYWTPGRMRAALPLDAGVGGHADRSARRTARGAAPDANVRRTATARPASARTPVPRAVGKLFFSDDGTDFVCSATAIRSARGNQVLTAGHCVHTGPNPSGSPLPILGDLLSSPRFFENWVFVPRYHRGTAPFGRWVATAVHVSPGWTEREDFAEDQAVLEVAPRRGRRLQAAVGGLRVAVGLGPRQRTRAWGWPAQAPYDGEVARRCDGASVRITGAGSPGDAALACDMTGGASGGPWLVERGVRLVRGGRGERSARPKRRMVARTFVWAVTSRRLLDSPHLVAHPLTPSTSALIRAAAR